MHFRVSLLNFECVFEVLEGRDGFSVVVLESEGKVSDEPHEAGEAIEDIFHLFLIAFL